MNTDENTVFWEIQVSASSPQDAALQARKAQLPGTHAVVFDVVDSLGNRIQVDLMECEGTHA